MLASESAALRLMGNPGPNDWRALAELQKEQAENCFYASEVKITGGGQEKVQIGWGQWCEEFTGLVKGEDVFVSYGSRNRTFGKCP